MKKLTKKTHDTLYSWQGAAEIGFPWVRINRLEWGVGTDWEAVCESRPMLCGRIYRGWNLYPPRFRWTTDQWGDWNSWRRILGDRRKWFRPNTTIEIGYGQDFSNRFFFEAFRFAPIGMSDKTCAEKIGAFMTLVFGKIPRPGEKNEVIAINDPLSEKNQIFWLGVILQGSRSVLG